MKAPVFLLAVSMLGNVALFAALALRQPLPSEPPPVTATNSVGANQEGAVAKNAGGQSVGGAEAADGNSTAAGREDVKPLPLAPNLWSALDSGDVRELVGRLRAAGFPTAVIRSVVMAVLREKRAGEFESIFAEVENTPYWKPESTNSGFNGVWARYSAIYREISKEMRALLSDDQFADTGGAEATARRRQFGDIPKSKIDLIQQINDDYNEMSAQIRASMQGVTLPEDREKLALLEREKRADLASILTPDELADYEMRTSQITRRLQPAMTIIDASEAEFRSIYAVMEKYKDQIYPSASSPTDFGETRRDAIKQANEDVKALLGEARYAEYLRASSTEYQQLYRLAQRNGVSVDAVNDAYALRDKIAAQATAIATDFSRPRQERQNELKTLAQNARLQLNSTLGPASGAAYAENARWIRSLDNGSAFVIGPDGSVSSFGVRQAAPKP